MLRRAAVGKWIVTVNFMLFVSSGGEETTHSVYETCGHVQSKAGQCVAPLHVLLQNRHQPWTEVGVPHQFPCMALLLYSSC